ncbi:MAG: response regulator [Rhodospirillaceae bacterium]|nr:response regulator [Rhodospirillaceae bacterium]
MGPDVCRGPAAAAGTPGFQGHDGSRHLHHLPQASTAVQRPRAGEPGRGNRCARAPQDAPHGHSATAPAGPLAHRPRRLFDRRGCRHSRNQHRRGGGRPEGRARRTGAGRLGARAGHRRRGGDRPRRRQDRSQRRPSGRGHRPTEKAAIDLAKKHLPHLVLADIQLRDGDSGIAAVREILKAVSAPVIFVTGFPERLLTGHGLEPAFIITKPFNPEMLKTAMAHALNSVVV